MEFSSAALTVTFAPLPEAIALIEALRETHHLFDSIDNLDATIALLRDEQMKAVGS